MEGQRRWDAVHDAMFSGLDLETNTTRVSLMSLEAGSVILNIVIRQQPGAGGAWANAEDVSDFLQSRAGVLFQELDSRLPGILLLTPFEVTAVQQVVDGEGHTAGAAGSSDLGEDGAGDDAGDDDDDGGDDEVNTTALDDGDTGSSSGWWAQAWVWVLIALGGLGVGSALCVTVLKFKDIVCNGGCRCCCSGNVTIFPAFDA